MSKPRATSVLGVVALVLGSAILMPCHAAGLTPNSPVVEKIEPPNWWTNFSPELMLLVTGRNLSHASVSSGAPGFRIIRTQASSNGSYLFIWAEVGPVAPPGPVALTIKTTSGRTELKFPLLGRTDPRRPQGLSGDDVIYLIMPDRFADGDRSNDRPVGSASTYDRGQPRAWHGGDLRGVLDHLPYLRDLGVTALWLTPIWKNSPQAYHGYHATDMYAVDPHMGSLAEYQKLAAGAHRQGLKLIMDFVGNHVGPDHSWAANPPSPSWLHGTAQNHLEATYNFSGLEDPHAPGRENRSVLEGWFVNQLPDLNTEDAAVQQYLAQNALWWVETAGVDAIRIDTFAFASRGFWSYWHRRLRQIYPGMATIAEISDPKATITAFFQGGRAQWDGVDSGATTVFDYPLYYAGRDVLLRGQPVQRLIEVMQMDWLYARPDVLVPFFGNHDTSRFMGEKGASKQRLQAAFALLLATRGIPQIYYGDEIGIPGGDDPDNRRDFPGGFPGDSRNAFEPGGRTPDEQEIFTTAQALLRLRREHIALRRGKQINVAWDPSYYAFVRATAEEKLLVVANTGSGPRDLSIAVGDTALEDAHRLTSLFGKGSARVQSGSLEVAIPAAEVAIYAVQ
jgi:glycosidase